MNKTFGGQIKEARKKKGYSQRRLAILVGIDFTYLSKLENDRNEYPPKLDVIESISRRLELDTQELTYLAGRVTLEDSEIIQELARTYSKQMPILLRRLNENPNLVTKVLQDSSI